MPQDHAALLAQMLDHAGKAPRDQAGKLTPEAVQQLHGMAQPQAQPIQLDDYGKAALQIADQVDQASRLLDQQYALVRKGRFQGDEKEQLDAAARVLGHRDSVSFQQEVREIIGKAHQPSLELIRKVISRHPDLFGMETYTALKNKDYTGVAGVVYVFSARQCKPCALTRLDSHLRTDLGKGSRFNWETSAVFSSHHQHSSQEGVKVSLEGVKRGTHISALLEDPSPGTVLSYNPAGYIVKEVRQEHGGICLFARPSPEVKQPEQAPRAGEKALQEKKAPVQVVCKPSQLWGVLGKSMKYRKKADPTQPPAPPPAPEPPKVQWDPPTEHGIHYSSEGDYQINPNVGGYHTLHRYYGDQHGWREVGASPSLDNLKRGADRVAAGPEGLSRRMAEFGLTRLHPSPSISHPDNSVRYEDIEAPPGLAWNTELDLGQEGHVYPRAYGVHPAISSEAMQRQLEIHPNSIDHSVFWMHDRLDSGFSACKTPGCRTCQQKLAQALNMTTRTPRGLGGGAYLETLRDLAKERGLIPMEGNYEKALPIPPRVPPSARPPEQYDPSFTLYHTSNQRLPAIGERQWAAQEPMASLSFGRDKPGESHYLHAIQGEYAGHQETRHPKTGQLYIDPSLPMTGNVERQRRGQEEGWTGYTTTREVQPWHTLEIPATWNGTEEELMNMFWDSYHAANPGEKALPGNPRKTLSSLGEGSGGALVPPGTGALQTGLLGARKGKGKAGSRKDMSWLASGRGGDLVMPAQQGESKKKRSWLGTKLLQAPRVKGRFTVRRNRPSGRAVEDSLAGDAVDVRESRHEAEATANRNSNDHPFPSQIPGRTPGFDQEGNRIRQNSLEGKKGKKPTRGFYTADQGEEGYIGKPAKPATPTEVPERADLEIASRRLNRAWNYSDSMENRNRRSQQDPPDMGENSLKSLPEPTEPGLRGRIRALGQLRNTLFADTSNAVNFHSRDDSSVTYRITGDVPHYAVHDYLEERGHPPTKVENSGDSVYISFPLIEPTQNQKFGPSDVKSFTPPRIKPGFLQTKELTRKTDKLGRENCYNDGKRVPCPQGPETSQPQEKSDEEAPVSQPKKAEEEQEEKGTQEGEQGKAPEATQEVDIPLHGPSKPGQRKLPSLKTLPWKPPPLPQGKTGTGPAKRESGERSQTAIGDKIEEITSKIGLRSILPAGRRANLSVSKEGSSIDREDDHSGESYECKCCRTTATIYKCKMKSVEAEAKEMYAKKHGLGLNTLIAVLDEMSQKVWFYAHPGLTAKKVPLGNDANGWSFLGDVSY